LLSSKPKTDQKIKNDILNLEFESYTLGAGDSDYITEKFGNKNKDLDGKTIEFFYNERLDIPEFVGLNVVNVGSSFLQRSNLFVNIPRINVSSYIINLRKKLRDALNIPKVMKGLRVAINVLDGITDLKIMKTLPRYQKLKRLESGYERVISISLSLIHQYYWVDITTNESSIDYSLKEAIKMTSPLIIKLKHEIEELVKTEFKYDASEEKLIMSGRKY
jgi:hypothetical protein